jgi:5-methylcytosine-specific restriction endonuclease McrA
MVIVKSWQDLREKTFKRDNNKCVKCGKTTEKEIIVHDFTSKEYLEWKHTVLRYENKTLGSQQYEIAIVVGTMIADHIIPIALGGEEWDIDNLQTLCPACNKIKTSADLTNIAEERKREKNLAMGQTTLN